MPMSSLSSRYDWEMRQSRSPFESSRYKDPEIEIRPVNGSMIEVRVMDMNTGHRVVKMFDVNQILGIHPGMGMSMGLASMGMHACLADFPSSESESISKKLLKLFL